MTSVSVSVGEFDTLFFEFAPQLAEILDDAVVHDGESFRSHADARCSSVGAAMRRPARVAGCTIVLGQRLARQFFVRDVLSLPSARRRVSVPCSRVATPARIVAAIFEALDASIAAAPPVRCR